MPLVVACDNLKKLTKSVRDGAELTVARFLSRIVVFALFALAVATSEVHAQAYLSQIGDTSFQTTLPIEHGFADMSTGNVHLDIPLGSWPQRGKYNFTAALSYDSRIWQEGSSGGSSVWQPTNVAGSWAGWRLLTNPSVTGSITYHSQITYCVLHSRDAYTVYSNFQWTDPYGTVRTFLITTESDPYSCDTTGLGNTPTGSGFATDASGYKMAISSYTHATITAPDGTLVYPTYFKDLNGNYFYDDSNGNVIDTLGRKPLTVTTNCNGHSYQICYNVLDSQGTTAVYTVTTESIAVTTAFGQPGVTEYSGNITVVSSVSLPDGTQYTFGYDGYGELTSVTFPTTGIMTLTYGNFADAFGNENRWVASKAIGPGTTWTFTQQALNSINCATGYSFCQTIKATKPSGDLIQFDFDTNANNFGSWPIDIVYYSGTSTQVHSVIYTWNSSDQVTSIVTSKLDVANGPTTAVQYAYVGTASSVVSKISEWNYFPAGSQPTNPSRITTLSNFCMTSPGSILVTDGTGMQTVSQTNYTFDGYGSTGLTPLSGAVNHDDTNYGSSDTARCNATKISRWVSGATYLSSALTYDTTGQVRSSTDSNNNTTTMSYTDNYFNDNNANPPASYAPSQLTNAYLTSVTSPIVGTATAGFYFGTGQAALTTDVNGQTRYEHFYDPFSRATGTIMPDGGWTLASYPSETKGDSYISIGSATPTTSCTSCRHNQATLDTMGRPQDKNLVNDPDGETTTATSYDSNGRIAVVTTPYRGTSSGQDSYSYDAINRIVSITHQDGTIKSTKYGSSISTSGGITTQLCSSSSYGLGYPVLVIDEAGKKRQVWTDGFSRTIEVDEPDSSNNLTQNTCYGYDLNNNVLKVLTAAGQTRAYQYDGLSRATSVTVPENNISGTQYSTTYSYVTSGGAACSGNPGAVCIRTDGRGISTTTTYSYDALNRATVIAYSGSTPTVTYCYDGNNSTCISGGYTSTFGIGRRTAMSDGSGKTGWSYDKVGRSSVEQRTISAITRTISYTYFLDGSVKSITYPSGRVVSYNVGNAERPLSATDSNGTQYAISATYSPAGEVASAVYGQVSGGFGGITEQRQFNSRMEMTALTATSSNGTALNLAYCFTAFSFGNCSTSSANNNGSVTGVTNSFDSNESQIFGYDNLNRISSAATQATSGNDCWGQSFVGGIDQVANLTAFSVTHCSPTYLSVTSDGNNHLVASGYAYDAAGDMTSEAGFTYGFDAEQRITSAAGVNYLYDGNGLRVEKSSGTLYWRSVLGDTLAESDGSGNIKNEYIFLDRRIARVSSGVVNYFLAEPLGTIHTITSATGVPCYDANFTPYGQEMIDPNVSDTCPSNYKFDGYEFDSETGLYYARARYYNPRIGRFMSPDLLAGTSLDPQTLNLYAYVENSPTVLCDPTGKQQSAGGCPLILAGTGDNVTNSKDILDLANDIGANVVFAQPSMASALSQDLFGANQAALNAVQLGIQASSSGSSGPSSVFGWSSGGGLYSVVASRPADNVVYLQPYFEVSGFFGSAQPKTGAVGTYVYSGGGFIGSLLNATQTSVGGAYQHDTGCIHLQTCVFPAVNGVGQAAIPFNPGPKCEHRLIIQAGITPGFGFSFYPVFSNCGDNKECTPQIIGFLVYPNIPVPIF